MATAPNFIVQSLMRLAWISPMLLFYLLAMILSFVYWNRHPRPCLLVLLAVGLMLFTTVGFMVLQAYIVNMIVKNRWSSAQLSYVFAAIGLVRSIIHAGGLGLLLLAVFTDRPRSAIPAGPAAPESPMQ
ncbi:MAG TPA: hypothetical protein VM186_14820 [Planctomycetota bacterium]|nr:hypothetical protein [Planctomycetota bacterium]